MSCARGRNMAMLAVFVAMMALAAADFDATEVLLEGAKTAAVPTEHHGEAPYGEPHYDSYQEHKHHKEHKHSHHKGGYDYPPAYLPDGYPWADGSNHVLLQTLQTSPEPCRGTICNKQVPTTLGLACANNYFTKPSGNSYGSYGSYGHPAPIDVNVTRIGDYMAGVNFMVPDQTVYYLKQYTKLAAYTNLTLDGFDAEASSCNELMNSQTTITITDAPTYGVIAKVDAGLVNSADLLSFPHKELPEGGKTAVLSVGGKPYIYNSHDNSLCGYAFTLYGTAHLSTQLRGDTINLTGTIKYTGVWFNEAGVALPFAPAMAGTAVVNWDALYEICASEPIPFVFPGLLDIRF